MKIDLRYAIVAASFFAPMLIIRISYWTWGTQIEDLNEAAAFSAFAGTFAIALAAFIVFGHPAAKPIYWTIKTKPQPPTE